METMSDQLLIFLHIPKTAGSTFHALLNKRYSPRRTHNVFGSRYSEPEIADFFARSEEIASGIDLLKGHMPFGLHRSVDRPCQYISVLRDPVDRVVSQYFYIKKNSHNPLHEVVEGGNLSIAEFVESGIAVGMNNGQCRFLNGDLDEFPFNGDHSELYQRAIANVDNYFIWLGITERFDESVLVLSDILGWETEPYYIRENISPNRKPVNQIDPVQLDIVRRYNQYDSMLYQLANERLNQEIASRPGFEQRLEKFRLRNKTIQKRWSWLPAWARKFVT